MIEIAAILAAGFWAGMINVVVGSGTLVTFPTLLLFGYPPIVANISNNIGLVGGGLSGSWGYRREIRANTGLLLRLLPLSVLGGLGGALLLLVLPAEAFQAIVPILIIIGLVMVALAPRVQRTAAAKAGDAVPDTAPSRRRAVLLLAGIGVLGIYGGYFGAAQGILIVGLMSMVTVESLQRINAIKNVLTTAVNAVAAVTFMLFAWESIDWGIVLTIAVGATLGGLVGAKVGRRLPPLALRATILVIGAAALIRIAFFP
ncbi:Sulfite exporter TauE/SafE [Arthrobacter agilis]|uniref:sulfite exporter TauE/SafE family protein n=1 Tax=Arthrobacter agilis TaxID=37921 RepID=UPI000F6BB67D|nr:sulfite exporter TauE/SafE family protein [Arthrobacter agilis]VDR33486.1 Sulfite exporter TauE/SafE [Arthrobacter agilis]